MKVLDFIKNAFEEATKQDAFRMITQKTFGFISLENGAGTTTTMVHVAELLCQAGKKVCIFDANLFQPNVAFFYNLGILKKDSIVSSFVNNHHDIRPFYHQAPGKSNLWILSASPLDEVENILYCSEESMDNVFTNLIDTFDYVLVDIPYLPIAEWFHYSLTYLDKGFIVWDEQPDCVQKTLQITTHLSQVFPEAVPRISHVILNKRSKWSYPYEAIEACDCDLITEIPYLDDMNKIKIEHKNYLESGSKNLKYADAITKIIIEILKKEVE